VLQLVKLVLEPIEIMFERDGAVVCFVLLVGAPADLDALHLRRPHRTAGGATPDGQAAARTDLIATMHASTIPSVAARGFTRGG